MANKNILTYGSKVTKVEQDYYSTQVGSLYAFISKVEPWPLDPVTNLEVPEQPRQDQSYIRSVFNNIFFVKLLTSGDISPVIQRIDWTTDTVYDYYQDNINILEKDSNGFVNYKFYVRNKYNQVFKCLWNNNGNTSTSEPFFQPGNYGTNNIYMGDDGYKWKYIYTINQGDQVKFMDSSWMPVPIGNYTPNPIQENPGTGLIAGFGDIEVINVIDGGFGYDPANSTITVTITGDGTGATAIAEVTDGSITDIVVTDPGTNYTYVNVSISSTLGSGASVVSPISPIGGHGFDPVSELGCSHSMFVVEFAGNEGGLLPTDIDYRQIGLISVPTALSTYPNYANADSYKVSTELLVSPGFGVYINDEFVYQGASLEQATYRGRVVSFDPATNTVMLINIQGTPTLNGSVYGNSSKTARTLLSVTTPDFITMSGYLAYVENRTNVQRSTDGIEQFKFVLGY
jgi:hypothetical protein